MKKKQQKKKLMLAWLKFSMEKGIKSTTDFTKLLFKLLTLATLAIFTRAAWVVPWVGCSVAFVFSVCLYFLFSIITPILFDDLMIIYPIENCKCKIILCLFSLERQLYHLFQCHFFPNVIFLCHFQTTGITPPVPLPHLCFYIGRFS